MLSKPIIQQFVAQAHKRSYPPKHTILHAGDTPTTLFLILEGSVSVLLEDKDGKEIVLAYLGPGDFFGEMCLFPEQASRSAIVRTRTTPTLVAECTFVGFRQFARDHHEIMFEIAGQLAARLRSTNSRLSDLAFLDVAGRLAHILLDLSKKPDAMDHPRGRVVRISRQELARNAGCSREMAGRVLKKLEEDGLVQSQGRSIVVLNVPAV
jgi:CRP/FNR family cyclic AMP-dependent transcriptional regulator